MHEALEIVQYPDPRLKKMSVPVQTFDDALRQLAEQMFVAMRANKGVGLAAPQIGKNIRLFVMNATGKPGDDRVYVNPVLSDPDGEEIDEEGCLSIPDIRVDIARYKRLRMDAMDITGKPISETETGYIARVWQHETDHLNGTLLTDRMGTVARMAHRKALKAMEDAYAAANPAPSPAPKRKRSPRR